MLFDLAQHRPDFSAIEFDACIIGGGVAGITLAVKLGRAGRRVLLIEAGDREASAKSQTYYRGELGSLENLPLTRRAFVPLAAPPTIGAAGAELSTPMISRVWICRRKVRGQSERKTSIPIFTTLQQCSASPRLAAMMSTLPMPTEISKRSACTSVCPLRILALTILMNCGNRRTSHCC